MRQKKFYNVYEDLEVQLSTYTVKESDEGNKIEQRTKNGKKGNVLFFFSQYVVHFTTVPFNVFFKNTLSGF